MFMSDPASKHQDTPIFLWVRGQSEGSRVGVQVEGRGPGRGSGSRFLMDAVKNTNMASANADLSRFVESVLMFPLNS